MRHVGPLASRMLHGRGIAALPGRAGHVLASVPVLACAAALICAGRALPF
ncbi:hypothetical protein J2792_004041 [Novosphingobium capsulatum]|uniref:Uncharacterized protein n=2 Tax=Sphingomonadaceae TaxID=41297 RepID=A0ABU1MS31_9SPHN|nr:MULTISPECIES: hypothetical protein [unclassified Novosphingobium]MBB3654255.1 hypothetical protein [Novosphingobium sp. BK626]MDR6513151.1 hypothetical protein [Novosphingobium capsulatum]MBB3360077.1 hypothetical protein [Novosphingobium sp. BK256]MBB3376434.1 hypothetical protein [Novosphingobium sp. BK280]MBB3380850.1 hypothetical protein [Novosphingobium sp. BK258]